MVESAYNDRVKVTTTITGIGDIHYTNSMSDVAGFKNFIDGIGLGKATFYTIKHQTADEYEVGYGLMGTHSIYSPNFSRLAVISSSNSDAKVNFSAGTKDVFCTAPGKNTAMFDPEYTSASGNPFTHHSISKMNGANLNDSDMGILREGLHKGGYLPVHNTKATSPWMIAGDPIGRFYTNANIYANQPRFVLFYSGGSETTGITYDRLSFRAGSTTSSAHTVNIGIFTRNRYGWPSQRVHNVSFTNPMASSGQKDGVGDFTLRPGWYYAGLHSTLNCSVQCNYHGYYFFSYFRHYHGHFGSASYFGGDPTQTAIYTSSYSWSNSASLVGTNGRNNWVGTSQGPIMGLRLKSDHNYSITAEGA